MRRLPILLAFGLVFALLVVAAATAAAPDFCNEDSPKYDLGHPTCSTTTTVTPPDPTVPPLAACETDISVPIEGKGRGGYECLWTPENDGQAEGKVTFTNMVGIKHGVVIVRDDAPGDICVIKQGWGSTDSSTFEATFDLKYGDLSHLDDPETTVVEYAAWEDQDYWNFMYEDGIVGAHWCAPQDGASDSIRLDTNGTPLHLRVGFNAGHDAHLDITLSPGQVP